MSTVAATWRWRSDLSGGGTNTGIKGDDALRLKELERKSAHSSGWWPTPLRRQLDHPVLLRKAGPCEASSESSRVTGRLGSSDQISCKQH